MAPSAVHAGGGIGLGTGLLQSGNGTDKGVAVYHLEVFSGTTCYSTAR